MEIIMSLHSSQKWLCIERLSIAVTAASALICMFPLPAFAANPIEELAKQKGAVGGGIDPHGDSWLSMQHSLEQFLHPEFMLRLFSIYYWQLPVRGSSHGTHVRPRSHPFLIWKSGRHCSFWAWSVRSLRN